MLDIRVNGNAIGQVSVQLQMTSRDWEKLKNSGVLAQVEQILMESEREKKTPDLKAEIQKMVQSCNDDHWTKVIHTYVKRLLQ